MDHQDVGVGERVRRYRRSRGLSLDQAAGLSGISTSYLSRLERGLRSVDSRALLNRIASALEVSVTDLTGQPYAPQDREHAQAHRGVATVRLALLDPGEPAPVELAALEADIARLRRALRAGDLVTQARVVPDALRRAQQADAHTPSAESRRLVALTSHIASFLMRSLGEMDLAHIAAERMRRAAEELCDDTWLAFAAYTQAHALAPAGAFGRAAAMASTASAAVTRSDREAAAARGACLLVASYATACTGDAETARAQLAEAAGVAGYTDEDSVIAGFTSFSDWNVVMHRLAVEVEAGDPVAALEAAAPVMSAPVPHPERMSYFWVDVGRAFVQLDRHRDALDAFRRAERAAALRVRLSPAVRTAVRDLLDSSQRRATGAQLRGLAERCGVLPG